MVGRDRELSVLEEALEAVLSGRGQIVLCMGEAGIGKTRLIHAFLTRLADRHATILTGGAIDVGEQGLPFGPIASALRDAFDGGPLAETAMTPALRSELAVLVPGLAHPGDGAAASRPDEFARVRLFEGLLSMLGHAAQRVPMVLDRKSTRLNSSHRL